MSSIARDGVGVSGWQMLGTRMLESQMEPTLDGVGQLVQGLERGEGKAPGSGAGGWEMGRCSLSVICSEKPKTRLVLGCLGYIREARATLRVLLRRELPDTDPQSQGSTPLDHPLQRPKACH